MDYKTLSEKQVNIAENLRLSGLDDTQIAYQLPAVERIVDDLEGVRPSRFSKTNRPMAGSYLAHKSSSPGVANALLDNLSQRVGAELSTVESLYKQRPIDIARAIAVGAESIKENQAMWEGLGLMDSIYEEADVIENRYAMAANMLAKYLQTNQGFPFDSNPMDGSGKPLCGMCPNQTMDFSAWLEMFRDWMDTLEPYMQLISKEIDRTIGAPTTRIKHLKIFTPDGDKQDVMELDLSHFNQITSDSLAMFATNRQLAAITLDDMTMTEQYIEETRKYIDVFVVDQSGSMSGTYILQAAAYLYNRLDKVVKGWAMMAVVEFDTSARVCDMPREIANGDPVWLINTPDKARWAMKNIVKRYASFVGGGTDIPAGVREGIRLAHKMEEFGGILPNITVITDNDTSIRSMLTESIDIPVNGLAVKQNTPLQDFAIKTGGSYNNLEQIDLNVNHVTQ